MSELLRANKITVKATDNGFTADLYRTHKHLLTVDSADTSWMPSQDATSTGKRESFRLFVIENAEVFGISWKPEDMRSDDNRRIANYTNDQLLEDDAIRMLIPSIQALIVKCRYAVDWAGISVDEIVPMTTTSKGTPLAALGIIDGKYEKSGNWAWATIKTQVTLKYHKEEVYLSIDAKLVSGQLKKPELTITPFNELVKGALEYAGIVADEDKPKEEVKPVEGAKVEEPVVEDTKVEEPVADELPKVRSKKSKKTEEPK